MIWEEFLNSPELVEAGYTHRVTGKDLFAKVIHDVLEGLNSIQACVVLLLSGQELPTEISAWCVKWDPRVKGCLSEAQSLAGALGMPASESANWKNLIAETATILNGLPALEDEFLVENQVSNSRHPQPFVIAARNMHRLNLIRDDILHMEYLKLWLTNYKDLI